jgi:hypothetical protein
MSQMTGRLLVFWCHFGFNLRRTHVTVFLPEHDKWFLQRDLINSGLVLNVHRESLVKLLSEFGKDIIFFILSHIILRTLHYINSAS